MLVTYTAAVVLSALLLFLVQPMTAKMLLPRFGGSPSVWNACMLFFQTLLLAGYAYAHALTRHSRASRQVAIHAAVLALPLLLLPIGSAAEIEAFSAAPPVLQLLGWLFVAAGAPFFVLATSGPLLQRWFASTDHPEAGDPYFLYAASNAGSVAALVAYPLLVEPRLALTSDGGGPSQAVVWSAGYVALAGLVLVAGVLLLLRRRPGAVAAAVAPAGLAADVSAATRGRWILLALVPSSAMLGATQYLTTAIVSAPLLWVVPLLIYLATFILAFSRRNPISPRRAGTVLALLAAVVAGTLFSGLRLSAWLVVPLHAATLFAAGMVCHGRLAALRPAPQRLTQFYLMVALGGALGGAINAVAAPLVFDSVLEYPIVLVAACLLRPPRGAERGVLLNDLTAAALVALVILGADLVLWGWLQRLTDLVTWLRAALPTLVVLFLVSHRRRFALGLAVFLALGWFGHRLHDRVLHAQRTFYGVHKVVATEGPTGIPLHKLIHGPIGHGSQARTDALRTTPTTYYHPSGPIGQVFRQLGRTRPQLRAGLVGLGAGTLAAYGRDGMHFTYYEIDAEVVRIATDPQLFSYVADSPARIDFVVGDGRLTLAGEPDAEFDLIVLDAFQSDSVPVHLITREALQLYLGKLRPGGLLALHMTTRYLDLDPVVQAIARDLQVARVTRSDEVSSAEQAAEDKAPSTWTLLAADPAALAPFRTDRRWVDLSATPASPRHLWTDRYSDIVGVLELW